MKEKELIPVEKLVLLLDALQAYRDTMQSIVIECQEQDVDGVRMDGWPTLAAAILQIQTQCGKFVSRTSKMKMVDPHKLLMPHHIMPYQRKKDDDSAEDQQQKESVKASRKGGKVKTKGNDDRK